MASFRKMPSGWVQAVIRRTGQKPLYKTFPNKMQAQEWARTIETEIDRGTWTNTARADNTTLGEVLEKYREWILPRTRDTDTRTSRIDKIKDHSGHLAFSKVTAECVMQYIDTRLAGGVTSETVRKEISIWSRTMVYGRAVLKLETRENPVTTARQMLSFTKTLKPYRARDRRLSNDEIERITVCGPAWLHDIVVFAIESCMREGEIARMRRDQIKQGILHIPETKTDSPRHIPLSNIARRILDHQQVNIDGRAWRVQAHTIGKAFRRACIKSGVEDARFHDLRHEGISRLFEAGLTIPEVAAISGHKSWAMLKRYTHLKPADIGKKLDKQEAIYSLYRKR